MQGQPGGRHEFGGKVTRVLDRQEEVWEGDKGINRNRNRERVEGSGERGRFSRYSIQSLLN